MALVEEVVEHSLLDSHSHEFGVPLEVAQSVPQVKENLSWWRESASKLNDMLKSRFTYARFSFAQHSFEFEFCANEV